MFAMWNKNMKLSRCFVFFQWQGECTGKNLMEATADTLKKM
jgi:hypothetical protein